MFFLSGGVPEIPPSPPPLPAFPVLSSPSGATGVFNASFVFDGWNAVIARGNNLFIPEVKVNGIWDVKFSYPESLQGKAYIAQLIFLGSDAFRQCSGT